MQTQTKTEDLLADAQRDRVRVNGIPLSPSCALPLDVLVRNGAKRLDETDASPELVEQARTNLERLLDTMAAEARAQNATELHEWSLTGALGRLCPLFPFC